MSYVIFLIIFILKLGIVAFALLEHRSDQTQITSSFLNISSSNLYHFYRNDQANKLDRLIFRCVNIRNILKSLVTIALTKVHLDRHVCSISDSEYINQGLTRYLSSVRMRTSCTLRTASVSAWRSCCCSAAIRCSASRSLSVSWTMVLSSTSRRVFVSARVPQRRIGGHGARQ